MTIITGMNERLSKFVITSADEKHCQKTFNYLEGLTDDRYIELQKAHSEQDKFSSLALEGLVVFLSCKRKGLNLQGSFVHHDEEADQLKFKQLVSHLDPEADIKLDTKVTQSQNHPLHFS